MQKINQFNQYLLEKYPTFWNTKFVWMLLITLVIHVFFFLMGYFSHIDPTSLQKSSVKDDFYTGGYIFVQVIISVLLLVGWLIMLFKNNAFKSFYPTNKLKLFSQFLQYFIIIFASITFYFSFMTGFRVFITTHYPDKEMKTNVDIINRSYPFLSQNLEEYTLDNRLSPKPFYDLYCETDIRKIDRSKKYFVYYDRVYQYFSTYSKTVYKKDKSGNFIEPEPENSKKIEAIRSEKTIKSETFYYKKEVVDLSKYIATSQPSYYNFSTVFYDAYDDRNNRNYDDYQSDEEQYYDRTELSSKGAEINRKTIELLDKKNPQEIEVLLSQFLQISKKFKIDNNLKAKEWVKLVYFPNNFELKKFIRTNNLSSYESGYDETVEDATYAANIALDSAASATSEAYVNEQGRVLDDTIKIIDFNPNVNKQLNPNLYYKSNLTNFYYYQESLKDLLNNVDLIKQYNYFEGTIHVYFWIAFFLATLIFCFRITGLKPLLFSIICAGVVSLLVALISIGLALSIHNNQPLFTSLLGFFILVFIFCVPLFMMTKFSKMVTSLFVIISINAFVPFVLLIFTMVDRYQNSLCTGTNFDPNTGEYVDSCKTILEILDINLSYILLISGFVFMYFYSDIIRKWKARPE